MNKVEKIQLLLKRVLIGSPHEKDYKIAITFIIKRSFIDLQDLVQSIIIKEENKPKIDRIINFDMLIEVKELIDDYVDQLTILE